MNGNSPEQFPPQIPPTPPPSTFPEPSASVTSPRPAPFAPSFGTPAIGDRILVVVDGVQPDPLLDRYLEIMAAKGHPGEVLMVPGQDPHAARSLIRAHAGIREGSIRGIQIFGRTIPSFRLRLISETFDSRGASDLPFGSGFGFFDRPFNPAEMTAEVLRKPAWNVADLTSALLEPQSADYSQDQWVARIFRLDPDYLDNLAKYQPPPANDHNMLIVNADPIDKNDSALNDRVQDRYRARYASLTEGRNSKFAFLEKDFGERKLFDYLAANLVLTPDTGPTKTTFLSIADHGSSSNLENLPPSRNGIPQLPRLPAVVEFASCGAGDWMEEEDPCISVVESALRNGCLTAIAAQCLLAWNFTRGFSDPNPGTDPRDQDNQNPAPMLDVWPNLSSLGWAQMAAVSQALNLLKTSVYNNKPHIAYQVLCGHNLFGNGSIEFGARSFL